MIERSKIYLENIPQIFFKHFAHFGDDKVVEIST